MAGKTVDGEATGKRMKVLAVCNQKGGTGKSAVTTNLAFCAAEQGWRVLVVDFDPQHDATSNLIGQTDPNAVAAIALFGSQPLDRKPQESGFPRISVIFANETLRGLDEDSSVDESAPRARLAELANSYDLCVIDTPPTLGKRLKAALIASDFVVMPFQPARESISGVDALLQTIEGIRQGPNPRLAYVGFLANRVNFQSRSDRELLKAMGEGVGELLLPQSIAERTRIKDALAGMHPVWKNQRGGSDKIAGSEMKRAMEAVLERVL